MFLALSSLSFFDHIKKKGIKTTGRILSYESDEDGHKTPIIEFKTLEGKFITKKPYYYASTDLSIFKNYKNNINKNVEIIYSPKKPEKFVIKSEKSFNYGSLIFMIIISLIFLGIAIGKILGNTKIWNVKEKQLLPTAGKRITLDFGWLNVHLHEESSILAEKTQSAGIANSLTGDTLPAILWKTY